MGLLTDFIICSNSDLQERCSGWVPRLEQPKQVERKNPFTGEIVTVESREPELPSSGAMHGV
jgi:hypothetical protein